ncbi:CocE/NonD family hydrolase [Virgibacillus sp. AGTR]|uniref:CocE/NonD family hydrolase n=1 Tax=Virgibacillus sp. AGTR TaxID=2812055 RepID=UPI001963DBE8|nr:CocE/NonD family hydrolase [Virgibacillus sp. AGTR]MCC2252661.1 CocE/NonD family hydrolase [Virgibacillus sp. AGTR]QRZ19520.1 CocE/NonD family hydrolase [Virgibacillus sp. AGTR]
MKAHNLLIDKNIICELSDGTILRSDVYRPTEAGEFPVLMLRLPYNKETPRYYNEYLEVPRMVEAGYVVILQDVRGRYASDGEFYPFVHEGKDGYEAVEWAARLPFSNGKVGLFGMSYHGYTQLAAAVEQPPSLKAIAPVMTMADPFGDMIGTGSTPHAIGKFETWVLGSIIEDQLKRKNQLDDLQLNHYLEHITEYLHEAPASQWSPMKDLDPDSFFFDVMQGRLDDHFIERVQLESQLRDVDIPALFMGGWFDALLSQTLQAYKAYHGEKMLWIGPWTHEQMTGHAGEKFFEVAAKNIGVDQITDPTEVHIQWFDKWLKDKPLYIQKPVQLYLMGQQKWAAYEEFPIVKQQEYFLESNGKSQTSAGDGKLVSIPSCQVTESSLTLDPYNPVPTRGGGSLIAGVDSGIFDINDLHERNDVLVYTTKPISNDIQLLGTLKAEIWCSSPTSLCDISLRIADVDPSGRAWVLMHSFHREKVIDSHPICLLAEIGTTAYTLPKGHQIRLDIAASNAPLYDINLNNGKTTKTHKDGVVANETIYHGGKMASKIIVPFTMI